MTDWNAAAAEALAAVRERRVLVHSITNYVVMNTTANALLAAGASPVMAHAREEVEDMAALAGAVVLNIGTLSPSWVDAMRLAGTAANRLGTPVILDPVGAGATPFRTSTARALARELEIAVIRGNPSEILSVSGLDAATKGVDAAHDVDAAALVAVQLASRLGTTVAITGQVDLVTDGEAALEVRAGHPLMGRVTGTGCVATALVAAFCAVEGNPVAAAAGALAYLGLAGERAARRAEGPGSFQVALIDALASIEPADLTASAAIREVGP
ncbi:MAG TPA: hydroxyethylthiazole kinase [Thermoanaerobaculales bacterium]|nr:hydroxyethylthiazole kinase [Thermoanaerobaculales bacterium]HPA82651.1 hydroxyethylthiazole kinase [Thermoanaerobaculales bacterium]HQL31560.1 hydroxyethylthiazole kinase [Thermoanaerobaculales bacterium]HQN95399.1 hydroxyethylthiazole kinase [Thermoanaerobaculales bacterium]HQP44004.1 hydroxyethylthiazole kinase [Thermoanaerobaculales bacterium]